MMRQFAIYICQNCGNSLITLPNREVRCKKCPTNHNGTNLLDNRVDNINLTLNRDVIIQEKKISGPLDNDLLNVKKSFNELVDKLLSKKTEAKKSKLDIKNISVWISAFPGAYEIEIYDPLTGDVRSLTADEVIELVDCAIKVCTGDGQ